MVKCEAENKKGGVSWRSNEQKELLEILADGIDPLTGEVLPDDHVCNKGEIVRALHCAVEEMSRRRKRPLPENNGKPWTEELDSELCRLFDEGMKKKSCAPISSAAPARSSPGWKKLGRL